MWNLFTFLFEVFLKDVSFVNAIAKILKGHPASVFKLFMTDPTKFAEKLGEMGAHGRKQFREEIRKAREKYPNIISNATNPLKSEITTQLTKTQAQAKEKAKEIIQGGGDEAPLSSSWLSYGVWNPVSPIGVSGDLTLTVKTGNSYTYPGVPRAVWDAMKLAKGKNGSGAGSVFWNMFLHSFKGSAFGQMQARVFKLAGVKSMSPTQLAKILKG